MIHIQYIYVYIYIYWILVSWCVCEVNIYVYTCVLVTGMRQNFNIAIRDSKRVETIITSNRSLNIKICRCVIAAPRDAKSQNMSLVIFAVSCTKAASWCSVIFIHFQCHVRIPEAGPTQNVCKHLLCRMVGAGWLHAHKHEDILKGRRPCHCISFKPVSKNNVEYKRVHGEGCASAFFVLWYARFTSFDTSYWGIKTAYSCCFCNCRDVLNRLKARFTKAVFHLIMRCWRVSRNEVKHLHP